MNVSDSKTDSKANRRELLAVAAVIIVIALNIAFFLSQYRIIVVHRSLQVEILDPLDIRQAAESDSDAIEGAEGTVIEATAFSTGNLNRQPNHFGLGIVIDGGRQPAHAMWRFTPKESGNHDLWTLYASGEPRPVRITCNGRIVTRQGMSAVTGGFTAEHLRWTHEGTVLLNGGRVNTFQIRADKYSPHLRMFKLIPEGTIPSSVNGADSDETSSKSSAADGTE